MGFRGFSIRPGTSREDRVGETRFATTEPETRRRKSAEGSASVTCGTIGTNGRNRAVDGETIVFDKFENI